jgi:gliding motility-associated-like protein
MKAKIVLFLFPFFFISILGRGQTILNPGDLVILGVDANLGGNPDEISFACFKDITTGTEIQITDQGYERCYAGLWGSNEGGAKLTRTGGTIPAGTVITFRTAQPLAPYIVFAYPDANWSVIDLGVGATAASFNLNSGGDQVYFAQGGTWTPGVLCSNNYPGIGGSMLFAFSTSGSWISLGNSTQMSGLYPGMSCYNMVSPTSASDFVKYTGPLTAATQANWITRIGTTANWTRFTTSALYLAGAPDLHTTILPILPGTHADWTSPGTICQTASPINLNSLISGLGLPGGTWSGTGVTGNMFNPSGLSGVYNITYTIDCPCCISQTHTITVVNPVATASSNSAICEGQTLNLTSTGGTTYSWSGPNSFTSTSQNPSIAGTTLAESGTYIVTVTNTNGCSSTAQTTVTINSSPTATASSNSAICIGQTLNLTASGGTSYSWSGPNGFTNSAQNPSISGATLAASGTYIVTVTNLNGCSSTAQTTVTVNSSPTATASSNSAICSGQTLNLTSSGGTSYSWSGPNSFTSTSQNPSIAGTTLAESGTYIVTVTNTNGCSSTAQTTVAINSSPTATASSNSAICSGQTLNLTSSGGTSYSWSGPNSFTSTSQNPSIAGTTLAESGTYIVTVTNTNGCSSTAQTTVAINSSPTATASSNSAICIGQTLNLTSSGGASYSWSGPNGFTNSAQNPSIPGATLAAAGIYTVTVSNGCSSTAQITVIINTNPTATASSNSAICEGQTLNLTSSGGTSYSWSGPNSFTSTSQNPSIAGTTLAESGTYIVTVTNTNGCSSTAQTTVAINSSPTATASSNSAICIGQTLNLTSSGGASYSWSGPNGFTNSAQNPSIPGATLAAAGIYTVTVSNGCSSTAQITVIINTNPTATASSNSAICEGQTLNLTSSGGTSYSWSGPNGFTNSAQNPSIPGATLAAAGIYTVTVSNGCSSTAQITVIINTNPTATASSNSAICEGQTLNLTSSGGTSYSWSGPNGFTNSAQNPSIPGATLAAAGIYTVTVSNGCSSTAQITVIINTNPTATASSNSAICEGQTLNLTSSGGTSYSWSGPNGFTNSAQNPSIPGATLAAAGIYTVTVSNGCSSTAQTIVAINSSPTATASSNSAICEGQTLSLISSGGTSYSWSGPNGFTSTSQNPSISGATLAASGTYIVTVTNSNGCFSTAQTTVLISSNPTATASSNSAICSGQTLNLTSSGGTSYGWSGPNGFTSTIQNPSIPGGTLAVAGIYTVSVTNSYGCSDIASVTINVFALPTANAGNDTTIMEDGSAQLHGSGGAFYSWIPSTGLSCSDCPSPISNPLVTTMYILAVSDSNGCTNLDTVTIFVHHECGDIFIPNAFSPNADGNNDLVCVRGHCIQTMTFAMYNRWGEVVFESKDQNICWDGTYQGKPLNPDVFVYCLEATLMDGTVVTKKGNITLFR